jgi:hypothetical protein
MANIVSFDEEQIKLWKEDEAVFAQFRREIEHEQHLSFQALLMGTDMQIEVFAS